MKLYLRILGFLRPHAGIFAISIVAMIIFAALDVSSFILLAPFLAVLFRSEAAAGTPGAEVLQDGGGVIGDIIQWSMADMLERAEPMDALRNVVLLLFFVYLVKNVALYIQQYTVSVVQGRVTRDLRNEVYEHLLHLDLAADIPPIRAEFERLVEQNPLWDKRVKVLQVTGMTPNSIEVRLLMSASDSGSAFDLQCQIREAMLAWLHEHEPEALARRAGSVR